MDGDTRYVYTIVYESGGVTFTDVFNAKPLISENEHIVFEDVKSFELDPDGVVAHYRKERVVKMSYNVI